MNVDALIFKVEELKEDVRLLAGLLCQPDDRLWKAGENRWYRLDGDALEIADPPPGWVEDSD